MASQKLPLQTIGLLQCNYTYGLKRTAVYIGLWRLKQRCWPLLLTLWNMVSIFTVYILSSHAELNHEEIVPTALDVYMNGCYGVGTVGWIQTELAISANSLFLSQTPFMSFLWASYPQEISGMHWERGGREVPLCRKLHIWSYRILIRKGHPAKIQPSTTKVLLL